MGRTPVREAIKRLALENLVTVFPRRGTFASEINITDLAHISDVRAAARGSRRLPRRRADHRRAAARARASCSTSSRSSEGSDDVEALMALDARVHRFIYRCAGNPYLEETLGPLLQPVAADLVPGARPAAAPVRARARARRRCCARSPPATARARARRSSPSTSPRSSARSARCCSRRVTAERIRYRSFRRRVAGGFASERETNTICRSPPTPVRCGTWYSDTGSDRPHMTLARDQRLGRSAAEGEFSRYEAVAQRAG